jgi:hypothetical protein
MNSRKRPIAILILCCLYVAVGAVTFAYHFPELLALQRDSVWVELTELLAILAGVFMFFGRNWARWLAIVWIAFHVAMSYHAPRQLAIHFLFFALIAWVLFRADARAYFGAEGPGRNRQS